MTAKCVDVTTPRSGPRTVLFVVQNCWSSRLIVDHSYDRVI